MLRPLDFVAYCWPDDEPFSLVPPTSYEIRLTNKASAAPKEEPTQDDDNDPLHPSCVMYCAIGNNEKENILPPKREIRTGLMVKMNVAC